MIFMQPGIPIIEFLPKQTMNDKCYFALAGVMKHSYHYLFCEINGPSHITADYRVNVTALKQLLAGVIAVSEEQ